MSCLGQFKIVVSQKISDRPDVVFDFFGAGVGAPGVTVKPRRIVVHADEFNECIGPTFIPLVNKARGAGVSVIAYTQTLADIEACLGREALARQVVGNFNTLITCRVREKTTADYLCAQLEKADSVKLMKGLGAGVYEIALPFRGDAYRAVYAVQIGKDIWVIHAF